MQSFLVSAKSIHACCTVVVASPETSRETSTSSLLSNNAIAFVISPSATATDVPAASEMPFARAVSVTPTNDVFASFPQLLPVSTGPSA